MPSFLRHLQAMAFTLAFLITYPIVRLFPKLFPGTFRKFVKGKLERAGITGHDVDAVAKIASSGMAVWTHFCKNREAILYGEVYEGKPAPNAPVVNMDGVTQGNLLDFAKAGRPLVINFGSCSWPPFIEKLAEVTCLYHEYKSLADFLTIYIQEAHATDGWAVEKNAYEIANHRKIQDRIAAAQMLEERDPAGHLVVDTISDKLCKLYCAYPERLCIVLDGIVQYYGKQGPFGYKPEEVKEWLQKYSEKQK